MRADGRIMPLLFAYGTLLDARVQRAVFGRRLEGRPDVLPGFVRGSAEFRDPHGPAPPARYPDIVPTGRETDRVPGQTFELGADDLRAADAYETSAYIRREVTLASGCAAWVYMTDDEPDD
jgi:hypothetical protein